MSADRATFLEIAAPLAELGIRVFPLTPRTKIPPSNFHFKQEATTDADRIREWNLEDPRYNVAMLATPETVCFLEFDVSGGIKQMCAEMGQPQPQTRVQKSGRGFGQMIFLNTERSRKLNNRSVNLPEACVDPACEKAGKLHHHEWFSFRGNMKYLVGAGSTHPNGNLYGTARPVAPIPIPDWVCDFIERHSLADEPEPAINGTKPEQSISVSENFDFDDLLDSFEISIAGIKDDRWHIVRACPGVGRAHEGSKATAFYWDGETLGWKCFAQECPLHNDNLMKKYGKKGIRGFLKYMNDQKREAGEEPYRGEIWEYNDVDIFEGISVDIDPADVPSESAQQRPKDTLDYYSDDYEYTDTGLTSEKKEKPVNQKVERQVADALAMPEECLYGWIGEKARELDGPLGASLVVTTAVFGAQRLEQVNGIMPQTYNIVLAPIHGGKTVLIKRGLKSFELLPEGMVKLRNLASDRGIYTMFNPKAGKNKRGEEDETKPQETKSHLLVSKEFKDTLNKLSIRGSSLAPVLCDLWDDFEAGTADKFGEHSVNVCLNILGALPVSDPSEFAKHFGTNTGGGFYDRCIYAVIPRGWKWNHEWKPNPEARFPKLVMKVPSFCYQMASDWKEQGIYADVERDRLAEIALRLAVIWTSANHQSEVTKACMNSALAFVQWQEKVRHHYSAGVAENQAAECSSAIISAFSQVRDEDGKTTHENWRALARRHNWHRKYGDMIARQRDALIKDKLLLPRIIKHDDGKSTKDESWLRLNEDV